MGMGIWSELNRFTVYGRRKVGQLLVNILSGHIIMWRISVGRMVVGVIMKNEAVLVGTVYFNSRVFKGGCWDLWKNSVFY